MCSAGRQPAVLVEKSTLPVNICGKPSLPVSNCYCRDEAGIHCLHEYEYILTHMNLFTSESDAAPNSPAQPVLLWVKSWN